MKIQAAIKVLLVSFLLFAGCSTTSTGTVTDTGCPPGYTRIDDENTGTYDCASRQDMEDIGDIIDEHKR